MKHHNMLPYRRAALAAATLFIANTSAQEWGGQSQQYCSNQNTGSDFSASKYLTLAHVHMLYVYSRLTLLTQSPISTTHIKPARTTAGATMPLLSSNTRNAGAPTTSPPTKALPATATRTVQDTQETVVEMQTPACTDTLPWTKHLLEPLAVDRVVRQAALLPLLLRA
jgi:hypothetical protein